MFANIFTSAALIKTNSVKGKRRQIFAKSNAVNIMIVPQMTFGFRKKGLHVMQIVQMTLGHVMSNASLDITVQNVNLDVMVNVECISVTEIMARALTVVRQATLEINVSRHVTVIARTKNVTGVTEAASMGVLLAITVKIVLVNVKHHAVITFVLGRLATVFLDALRVSMGFNANRLALTIAFYAILNLGNASLVGTYLQ